MLRVSRFATIGLFVFTFLLRVTNTSPLLLTDRSSFFLAANKIQHRMQGRRLGAAVVTRLLVDYSSEALMAPKACCEARVPLASSHREREKESVPAASSAAAVSLYRRVLPSPAVAFSSAEGLKMFREALENDGAGVYFALAEQFHTQAEPSFCGLASLVMVLNALAVDPERPWKGVWRWYAEELLECCEPLAVVKEKGVTIDKLACTARCNELEVDVVRATEDEDEFTDHLRAVIRRVVAQPAQEVKELLVASYSRKPLGQTGDGHFSPLAAYHAASDSVLILDTARFKYPPHWIPLRALAQAMRTKDAEKNRGYLLFKRKANKGRGPALFQLRFLDHRKYLERAPTTTEKSSLGDELQRQQHLKLVQGRDDRREEKILIAFALSRLDALVAKGLVPRAELFEDDAACCGKLSPKQIRELLAEANAALGDPESTLALGAPLKNSALATLFAVPPDFWPALLSDTDASAKLTDAVDRVMPPALKNAADDLRRKFKTYLDFELDDDDDDKKIDPL